MGRCCDGRLGQKKTGNGTGVPEGDDMALQHLRGKPSVGIELGGIRPPHVGIGLHQIDRNLDNSATGNEYFPSACRREGMSEWDECLLGGNVRELQDGGVKTEGLFDDGVKVGDTLEEIIKGGFSGKLSEFITQSRLDVGVAGHFVQEPLDGLHQTRSPSDHREYLRPFHIRRFHSLLERACVVEQRCLPE